MVDAKWTRQSPTIAEYKLCEDYEIKPGESAKFYFSGEGYGSCFVNVMMKGVPWKKPWGVDVGCVYDDGTEVRNWVRDYVDVGTGEPKSNNGTVIIGFNLTVSKHYVEIFNKDEEEHEFTAYVRLLPQPHGPSNQNYMEGNPRT